MFRALLRKQLMELNAFYFISRKTGERRSPGKIVGMFILFGVIFLYLAVMFFGLSISLANSLITPGIFNASPNTWMYFSIMGVLAFLLGIFGSVFNTYAGLYLAKDNDLLLSLPVPPYMILAARMVSVFLMSLLYSAVVWVPAVIAAWIVRLPSVTGILYPILLTVIAALFITVVTCALGYLIALASQKLKNNRILTLIITVIFLGGYMTLSASLSRIMMALIDNAQVIGTSIKKWVYLLYLLGDGAAGGTLSFLLFLLITAVCLAVCILIMSRSFLKVVSSGNSAKKAVYHETALKTSKPKTALLKKELRRFTSSSAYMLNCGLGIILMPAAAIAAVIMRGKLMLQLPVIEAFFPAFTQVLPVIFCMAIGLIASMDCISAPSVSLEGKTLWMIRSMPVDSWLVLDAKANCHALLNSVPAVISMLILGIGYQCSIPEILLSTVFMWLFVWFTAEFGLAMNLRFPNLSWTSETIVIKQGLSIMFALFGGWLVVGALCGSAIGLSLIINPLIPLGINIVVISVCLLVTHMWLKKGGVRIFESL